jgi:ankyrin repeat protein
MPIELTKVYPEGDVQRVEELMEDGADINHADEEGDLSLHRACNSCSDKVLALLSDEGGKVGVHNVAA